jgi:predicted transcriptional regulator
MVDEDTVEEVWEQLQATPGANLRQLHLRSGVPTVTVTRIVEELKREGRVKEDVLKKSRRYYPRELARSKRDRRLLAYMNQPRARRIMTHLLEHPKIRQKELAEDLCIDPPAAAYWLRHFEDTGVLDVRRKGTACHYKVKEPQRVKKALELVDEDHVLNGQE